MASKKNEAKIKFTAETGEFNDAIKKSNDELSTLRAEMKLNATQMKATGDTVEGLEKQHELLGKQASALADKHEALEKKLESAVKCFGDNSDEANKLRRQILSVKTEETKLQKEISDCNSALQKQQAAEKKSEKATKKLTDKIEDQESELADLKEEYVEATLQYGKNSKEAKQLGKQIDKLSKELKNNKKQLTDVTKQADKLDNTLDGASDAASGASGGFTVFKGAIANLASSAISSAANKLSSFISYLKELPSATREARQGMSIIDTSFEGAELTAEQGRKTVRDLYGVLGDNDRAVETATLIAKTSSSQEDLNEWVRASTGIFASYGESLPVEGLAEAANETAKTGKVTGTLADALNWTSKSASTYAKYLRKGRTAEDAFNIALRKCKTEEQKQALIRQTLTELYGEAADQYIESSGSMIDANKAAYDLSQAENNLATSVEPVTTAWDGMKAKLITAVIPAVESVSGLMIGALEWMKEHPTAVRNIAIVLGVLAAAIGIVIAVVVAWTVVQTILNAALMPVIGIVLLVVAVITALVAAGIWLYQNWDVIKQKAAELWASLSTWWNGIWTSISTACSNAWSAVTTWFSNIWTSVTTKVASIWATVSLWFTSIGSSISTACSNAWTSVTTWFSNIKTSISSAVSNAWTTVTTVFGNIKTSIYNAVSGAWLSVTTWFNNIKTSISEKIQSARDTVSTVVSGIKNSLSFTGLAAKVRTAFTSVYNGIKTKMTSVQTKVKSIIDKVVGFFTGASFTWPSIPLPHFSVLPEGWEIGDLLKGSIPSLGISWYAEGGIMTRPTVFGRNGNNMMVGGEAGPEAILPISKLEEYMANIVEERMGVVNLQALADAIDDIASRPIELNVNGRQIALATASDGDSVNGLRSSFKSRGLALD